MSDCRVTCRTCRTDKGRPKVWKWLCETCAEECQTRHRAETGHDTELLVIPEQPTVQELKRLATRAAWGVGW